MRYVILLQNNQASVYALGRGRSGSMFTFPNNGEGRKRLTEYLRERSGSLFSVVLDFLEEEHHRHAIPFVRGRDRRDILQRLQSRYFPESNLTCARLDKHVNVKSGKMTAGITGVAVNSDCEQWLKLLADTRTVVGSIGSLSLIGSRIITMLRKSKSPDGRKLRDCVFLVAQLGERDFRISVYLHDALLLSRKLLISHDLAAMVISEIEKTQAYVDRLPELAAVEDRTLLIVGDFSSQQTAVFKTDLAGDVAVLAATDVSSKLNLHGDSDSPYSDFLFARVQLRGRRPGGDFSTAVHRKYHRYRRVSHGVYALCLAMLGGAAITAAATAQMNAKVNSLSAAVYQLNNHALEATSNTASVVINDWGAEYELESVRDSIRVARVLEARAQETPFQYLSALADEITPYPGIRITNVNWSVLGPDPEQLLQVVRHPVNPAIGTKTIKAAYQNGLNATITGYVKVSDDKIGDALAVFNEFVLALRNSDPKNSITILEAPFGISDNSMTSGAGFQDMGARGSFILEVNATEVTQ